MWKFKVTNKYNSVNNKRHKFKKQPCKLNINKKRKKKALSVR